MSKIHQLKKGGIHILPVTSTNAVVDIQEDGSTITQESINNAIIGSVHEVKVKNNLQDNSAMYGTVHHRDIRVNSLPYEYYTGRCLVIKLQSTDNELTLSCLNSVFHYITEGKVDTNANYYYTDNTGVKIKDPQLKTLIITRRNGNIVLEGIAAPIDYPNVVRLHLYLNAVSIYEQCNTVYFMDNKGIIQHRVNILGKRPLLYSTHTIYTLETDNTNIIFRFPCIMQVYKRKNRAVRDPNTDTILYSKKNIGWHGAIDFIKAYRLPIVTTDSISGQQIRMGKIRVKMTNSCFKSWKQGDMVKMKPKREHKCSEWIYYKIKVLMSDKFTVAKILSVKKEL